MPDCLTLFLRPLFYICGCNLSNSQSVNTDGVSRTKVVWNTPPENMLNGVKRSCVGFSVFFRCIFGRRLVYKRPTFKVVASVLTAHLYFLKWQIFLFSIWPLQTLGLSVNSFQLLFYYFST